jgi:hypothetical protein
VITPIPVTTTRLRMLKVFTSFHTTGRIPGRNDFTQPGCIPLVIDPILACGTSQGEFACW